MSRTRPTGDSGRTRRARRLTMVAVVPMAFGLDAPASHRLEVQHERGETACRVSLKPETLRIRTGPSRVLAEFSRGLPSSDEVTVPPESGLRLLETVRHDEGSLLVLTIATWEARAGAWPITFGGRDTGCSAQLEVKESAGPGGSATAGPGGEPSTIHRAKQDARTRFTTEHRTRQRSSQQSTGR